MVEVNDGDGHVDDKKSTILTVDQAYNLFVNGVLGTKEFRSWLASVDGNFAAVRDADIDNEIDELARRRREALQEPQDVSNEG